MVRIRSIDDQEPRHPGDARDLDPIGRPPGAGDVAKVRDVLLVPTLTSDGDWERFPPLDSDPVDLAQGLALGRFDEEEAELVMNACTERGHFFWGQRQFGTLYAYVLDVSLQEYERHVYAWDVDGVLMRALKLSRLIRDNGNTPQFAARIVDFVGGTQQVIPQAEFHLEELATYRVREDRDWMTREEAEDLSRLLSAWWRNEEQLPVRVQRAYSLCEGVVHQPVVERALVMLFMGFEALINTGKDQVTKQVGVRLRALAREVGVDGVSRRFAEDMYDDRSSPAHGQELALLRGSPQPATPPDEETAAGSGVEEVPIAISVDEAALGEYLPRLALLQDLLRAAVRRAIEDPAFAAIFADSGTIDIRWPLSA